MLGEVLVDKVAMLSGAKTGFTFIFEGEEHLQTMSQGEGRGSHRGPYGKLGGGRTVA